MNPAVAAVLPLTLTALTGVAGFGVILGRLSLFPAAPFWLAAAAGVTAAVAFRQPGAAASTAAAASNIPVAAACWYLGPHGAHAGPITWRRA